MLRQKRNCSSADILQWTDLFCHHHNLTPMDLSTLPPIHVDYNTWRRTIRNLIGLINSNTLTSFSVSLLQLCAILLPGKPRRFALRTDPCMTASDPGTYQVLCLRPGGKVYHYSGQSKHLLHRFRTHTRYLDSFSLKLFLPYECIPDKTRRLGAEAFLIATYHGKYSLNKTKPCLHLPGSSNYSSAQENYIAKWQSKHSVRISLPYHRDFPYSDLLLQICQELEAS